MKTSKQHQQRKGGYGHIKIAAPIPSDRPRARVSARTAEVNAAFDVASEVVPIFKEYAPRLRGADKVRFVTWEGAIMEETVGPSCIEPLIVGLGPGFESTFKKTPTAALMAGSDTPRAMFLSGPMRKGSRDDGALVPNRFFTPVTSNLTRMDRGIEGRYGLDTCTRGVEWGGDLHVAAALPVETAHERMGFMETDRREGACVAHEIRDVASLQNDVVTRSCLEGVPLYLGDPAVIAERLVLVQGSFWAHAMASMHHAWNAMAANARHLFPDTLGYVYVESAANPGVLNPHYVNGGVPGANRWVEELSCALLDCFARITELMPSLLRPGFMMHFYPHHRFAIVEAIRVMYRSWDTADPESAFSRLVAVLQYYEEEGQPARRGSTTRARLQERQAHKVRLGKVCHARGEWMAQATLVGNFVRHLGRAITSTDMVGEYFGDISLFFGKDAYPQPQGDTENGAAASRLHRTLLQLCLEAGTRGRVGLALLHTPFPDGVHRQAWAADLGISPGLGGAPLVAGHMLHGEFTRGYTGLTGHPPMEFWFTRDNLPLADYDKKEAAPAFNETQHYRQFWRWAQAAAPKHTAVIVSHKRTVAELRRTIACDEVGVETGEHWFHTTISLAVDSIAQAFVPALKEALCAGDLLHHCGNHPLLNDPSWFERYSWFGGHYPLAAQVMAKDQEERSERVRRQKEAAGRDEAARVLLRTMRVVGQRARQRRRTAARLGAAKRLQRFVRARRFNRMVIRLRGCMHTFRGIKHHICSVLAHLFGPVNMAQDLFLVRCHDRNGLVPLPVLNGFPSIEGHLLPFDHYSRGLLLCTAAAAIPWMQCGPNGIARATELQHWVYCPSANAYYYA